MLRIHQVKVRAEEGDKTLAGYAAHVLRIPKREIAGIRIVRRSIDARKKPEIFYSYTLDVETENEERILRAFRGKEHLVSRLNPVRYTFPKSGKIPQEYPAVIVGMGPAGLFCAYFLALHGYPVLLLERGKCVEERQADVEHFWETGHLDVSSNVQFGEGGAGAFSDGKLNTLVRDKDGRNGAVLDVLVQFGAKESIRYDAKPHIGTDVLCRIVSRMRNEIVRLGGEVRFSSCVTDIEVSDGYITGVILNGRERIPCGQVVMACGHSARDTFAMLYEKKVPMEPKAFAVGFRVEHPQSLINQSQYGTEEPGGLGPAPYKVTAKASNGRGVYSFCMCPGGYVVNASSEEGRTAVNGMSYSGRNGKNANSAVIVSVTPEDFGSDHPLGGIAFQRSLEEKAYRLGGGRIPVQRYGNFLRCLGREVPQQGDGQTEEATKPQGTAPEELMPECKGDYVWADLSGILPEACNEAFAEGMELFGKQIRGFNQSSVILSGVESRTSSPVRICRDEGLQSAVRGLYPCGEGAGYAGGITSAAMDGIRVAEAIAANYAPAGRVSEREERIQEIDGTDKIK